MGDHLAPGVGQLQATAATADHVDDSKPTAEPGGGPSDASARTLRDLIDDPSQLASVANLLRPEHFTPVVHRKLYGLLLEMRAARRPIDPVTVAWEAARRGVCTDPSHLAGGVGPFAVANASEVRRLALLAQIGRAGQDLQSDSADLALTPGRLLQSAGTRLQSIEGDHRRRREPAAGARPERPSPAAQPDSQPEREATR